MNKPMSFFIKDAQLIREISNERMVLTEVMDIDKVDHEADFNASITIQLSHREGELLVHFKASQEHTGDFVWMCGISQSDSEINLPNWPVHFVRANENDSPCIVVHCPEACSAEVVGF